MASNMSWAVSQLLNERPREKPQANSKKPKSNLLCLIHARAAMQKRANGVFLDHTPGNAELGGDFGMGFTFHPAHIEHVPAARRQFAKRLLDLTHLVAGERI